MAPLKRSLGEACAAPALVASPQPPIPPPSYRLLTADELGLIKVLDVPAPTNWRGSKVVQSWGRPDKASSIQAMALAGQPDDDTASSLLAVSRPGGAIDIIESGCGSQIAVILPPPSNAVDTAGSEQLDTVQHAIPCLAFLRSSQQASTSGKLDLLSCSSHGHVRLHRATHDVLAGQSTGSDGLSTLHQWQEALSFKTCGSVACMALNSEESHVALGGDGCHLQLWDLATRQQTYLAKAAKPNQVGLVDMPHITTATFLQGAGVAQVVVGTGAGKLLLYDMRVGRRPQLEVAWGKGRVTALAAEPSGLRIWAGSGIGAIEVLDLRQREMQGAMHGAAGSVRSLVLHPGGEPLLASAGLDRYVRVHDTRTRRSLSKVYMKQHLSAVAWAPVRLMEPASNPAATVNAEEAVGAGGGHAAAALDDEWPEEQARLPAGSDDEQAAPKVFVKNAGRSSSGKRRKSKGKH